MFDPRDPLRTGPGFGIVSAFLPQGSVGCLAGLFVLLLIGIAIGLFKGPWMAVAVVAMVVLVPLIGRAIRAEIRKEDRVMDKPSQVGRLPSDAELADEERRDAMRRYARDADAEDEDR